MCIKMCSVYSPIFSLLSKSYWSDNYYLKVIWHWIFFIYLYNYNCEHLLVIWLYLQKGAFNTKCSSYNTITIILKTKIISYPLHIWWLFIFHLHLTVSCIWSLFPHFFAILLHWFNTVTSIYSHSAVFWNRVSS